MKMRSELSVSVEKIEIGVRMLRPCADTCGRDNQTMLHVAVNFSFVCSFVVQ